MPNDASPSARFIRGAGNLNAESNAQLWFPARWIAQLVQYLIAIIMVTMGEAFKSILSGGKKTTKSGRRTAYSPSRGHEL